MDFKIAMHPIYMYELMNTWMYVGLHSVLMVMIFWITLCDFIYLSLSIYVNINTEFHYRVTSKEEDSSM